MISEWASGRSVSPALFQGMWHSRCQGGLLKAGKRLKPNDPGLPCVSCARGAQPSRTALRLYRFDWLVFGTWTYVTGPVGRDNGRPWR